MLEWLAVRELATDRDRWEVEVANERGGHGRRLPDLVAWPSHSPAPVAIIIERPRPTNPKRQQAVLEGFKTAIAPDRYTQVRYQTHPVTARQLTRLAAQLGLHAPAFVAEQQITANTLTGPPPIVEPVPSAARRPRRTSTPILQRPRRPQTRLSRRSRRRPGRRDPPRAARRS